MTLDLRSSKLGNSFLKDRICNVEKHLHDMSLKLANYNKKLAHLRDSGDDFAKSVLCFSSKENLNSTLRTSLSEFSDIYTALQDYRDTQIQHIDAKVVTEFANYGSVCKKAKEELKRSFEACTTEFKKQIQLDKIRGKNPTNWQKVSQAEKEVNLAKEEANQVSLEMARRIDSFERNKLQDIKHTLLEFIKIEMLFYAKAIELHTKAYNVIKKIKVAEDLNEFSCHFRAHTGSLDAQCLSNTDVLKNIEVEDADTYFTDASSFSCILASYKSIYTHKNNPLILEQSNSSPWRTSDKFDFGDQSL